MPKWHADPRNARSVAFMSANLGDSAAGLGLRAARTRACSARSPRWSVRRSGRAAARFDGQAVRDAPKQRGLQRRASQLEAMLWGSRSRKQNADSQDVSRNIYAKDVWFSWRNMKTGTAETPVLRGVSLNVKPGEFVILVGGNGSGKSTLLRTLRQLYLPDAGAVSVPTPSALVFQDAGSCLMLPTVAADLMFSMPDSVETADMPDKVSAHLDAVGLRGFENRSCAGLSGGERQRVAVASALAMEPKAMMFDETTASMDQESRRLIVRMVRERVADAQQTPVLWVTHLLEEIEYADRVVILDRGEITHDLPPHKVRRVLSSLRENRVFWN